MRTLVLSIYCLLTSLLAAVGAEARAQGTAKPDLVFTEVVSGMPKGDQQAVLRLRTVSPRIRWDRPMAELEQVLRTLLRLGRGGPSGGQATRVLDSSRGGLALVARLGSSA
jgi:hypothetical protein